MFSPIQRFADELAMYHDMLTEQTIQEMERNQRRDDDEAGGSASVRVPRAPLPSGSPAMVAL